MNTFALRIGSLLLFLSALACAQTGSGQSNYAGGVRYVPSAPSGACASTAFAQIVMGTGAFYTCQSGIWAEVGGAIAFSAVTPGTNTGALVMGGSGSLTPTQPGQVAGSAVWLNYAGIPDPVLTGNASGGNLAASSNVAVQISFNTSLGETIPSRLISTTTPGGCGVSCSLTVTAPTLPSWATGYTVYSCLGVSCTNVLRQNASPACVNITANCVIQVIGAGVSPLTISTAWVQPLNVQATSCPPSVIPQWFVQDASGNMQTLAGVDLYSDNTAGPPSPGGSLTFCRRVAINDTGTVPTLGKNAAMTIWHRAGVGTVNTNQDRAIRVTIGNVAPDSTTYYGWEAIQAEVDVNGTPNFTGSPDGEISAGSFQASISNTNASMTTGSIGATAVRAEIFRSGVGTIAACTYCYTGILAKASNGATGSLSNTQIAAARFFITDTAGCTSCLGDDLVLQAPGNRFTSGNKGLFIEDFGANTSDWNIFSHALAGTPTRGRNWFGGNVYLPNIITGATTIGVTGSMALSGSLSTAQLGTPVFSNSGVGTRGASGATSYTYKLTAVDGNGKESAVSNAGTTAIGNATLDTTNYNAIVFGATFLAPGVSSYNIYRTASGGTPSSTGKIGNLPITTSTTSGNNYEFDDKGLAGDGSTPPTQNQTGAISGPLYQTTTNCAASGTAANPSVVSCAAAPAGIVYCDVAASGGTCTINTTVVTANSEILITPSAADNTLLSKTCNAAPTVVPFATLAAKVAGTSFTLNMPTLTVTGPCFHYTVIN